MGEIRPESAMARTPVFGALYRRKGPERPDEPHLPEAQAGSGAASSSSFFFSIQRTLKMEIS